MTTLTNIFNRGVIKAAESEDACNAIIRAEYAFESQVNGSGYTISDCVKSDINQAISNGTDTDLDNLVDY
jgi:hypothetical protein